MIDTFKRLVDRLDSDRVIWRFDPMVLTDRISKDDLLEKVERIGNQLKGYTKKLVFSFADILEYKKVKRAADGLEDLIDARQNYGERRVSVTELPERPLKPSDKMEVWNVFNLVLRRLAEKLVQGEIREENVTVADRMEYLLSIPEKNFTFSSVFKEKKTGIVTIVATFIAMLELTRLRKLRISQNESFGEIYCERIDEPRPAADDEKEQN